MTRAAVAVSSKAEPEATAPETTETWTQNRETYTVESIGCQIAGPKTTALQNFEQKLLAALKKQREAYASAMQEQINAELRCVSENSYIASNRVRLFSTASERTTCCHLIPTRTK